MRLFGITSYTAIRYVRTAHPERFTIKPTQAYAPLHPVLVASRPRSSRPELVQLRIEADQAHGPRKASREAGGLLSHAPAHREVDQ